MSPPQKADRHPRAEGGGSASGWTAEAQSTTDQGQRADTALFDVTATVGAYGSVNMNYTTPTDVVLARASQTRDVEWLAACDRIIVELADTGRPFSADDVAERLGPAPSSSALAARIRVAAKTGVITTVGAVPSSRESRRGGLLRLWVGAR